jgi:DNA-binding response OmpR family regulator
MSSQQAGSARDVNILILDDDEASQKAFWQVLDSEGWNVRVEPLAEAVLAELAGGEWTLLLANVAMTGLSGPVFSTLKELAQAPPVEAGRRRLRVLFIVPMLVAQHAQPILERERLPYTLKPFHLHDFLEKVSDLLIEAQAIPNPIRRVHPEFGAGERRRTDRRAGEDRRETSMFASRDEYFMTEEEIAEYEKQEAEERKRKQT